MNSKNLKSYCKSFPKGTLKTLLGFKILSPFLSEPFPSPQHTLKPGVAATALPLQEMLRESEVQ